MFQASFQAMKIARYRDFDKERTKENRQNKKDKCLEVGVCLEKFKKPQGRHCD